MNPADLISTARYLPTTTKEEQMTATAEAVKEIENLVVSCLADQSQEHLTFGPIIVEARKDHDDDDYFNICIVYEGNLELLDTAKALFMRTHIKRRLGEMGLPHYPVRVFAEKSEWEQVNREYAALNDLAPTA